MVTEKHILTSVTLCYICAEGLSATRRKMYHDGAVWVNRIRCAKSIEWLRLRHEQCGYTVMHEVSGEYLPRALREMGGILW